MNKTTDSSLSERELLAFVKLVRQHYREAKIKLTPEIVERMDAIVGESQQSNPATLREALWAQLEERAKQECPKGFHEDHECETCEHCHYYVDTAWIGVEAALAGVCVQR